MTTQACFNQITVHEPFSSFDDNLCRSPNDSEMNKKMDVETSSYTDSSYNNFSQHCGGNISFALSSQWSFDRSQLYPTSLPFNPLIQPGNLKNSYDFAKLQIKILYQKLLQTNLACLQSIDPVLENLTTFDQAFATLENSLYGIQISPPDFSVSPPVEDLLTDLESFQISLFSDERFLAVIENLKANISEYKGKNSVTDIEATLLKWSHKLKILFGSGLSPEKKADLIKWRAEAKKAEFEYLKALNEEKKEFWAYFELEELIGCNPAYNKNLFTWLGRLFKKGESGLQDFLDAYNLKNFEQNYSSERNQSFFLISKFNLAEGFNQDLINYLRNDYFRNHPDQLNAQTPSDLKVKVLYGGGKKDESNKLIACISDDKTLIDAFNQSFKHSHEIVSPKAMDLLHARHQVALLLGFSNYAELKSLDGQTLFAQSDQQVEHLKRIGKIVKEIAEKQWNAIVQRQREIHPNGLSPTYETSDLYKDILNEKTKPIANLLKKIEFGSPEKILREVTIPNLQILYGLKYYELTGDIPEAYFPPAEAFVFGNDCSVLIWDLFEHEQKASSAASVTIREKGRYLNYLQKIVLPLGSKKSNPQTELQDIIFMLHEPIHPASYLSPQKGQKDFFNLGTIPNFLNDLLTVFAETEYVQYGIPGGVDFWNYATVPDEKKPNQRRKITEKEIRELKFFKRLQTLEGLKLTMTRGVFLYDIHRGNMNSPDEMGKRFIDIATNTYSEPFSNQNKPYAYSRSWHPRFGFDNYGPVAIILYQEADFFYPYLSSLFENVGGGLKPENFRLLQEMVARVSALPAPKNGERGYIENLEKSMNRMLLDLHKIYGDQVRQVPFHFEMEDVYRKFKDYYKKTVE